QQSLRPGKKASKAHQSADFDGGFACPLVRRLFAAARLFGIFFRRALLSHTSENRKLLHWYIVRIAPCDLWNQDTKCRSWKRVVAGSSPRLRRISQKLDGSDKSKSFLLVQILR